MERKSQELKSQKDDTFRIPENMYSCLVGGKDELAMQGDVDASRYLR
ncbi:hypothetical protein CCACVL1_18464 [Corchorus capsularis]|uniref:Uncharacterized protein n=1 Tax=Corchorus capsularis TaxID=210143 RepID=A0A1R3HL66_COCAP|nr:hypothetical protein CCACVL1_18464 [Corchorus capsularis]